jgi:hypothetical protein
MKYVFFLLLLSNTAFAQISLDSIAVDSFEPLLKDDYFKFEFVNIKKEIYDCVDSILPLKSEYRNNNIIYWYLEVSDQNDTVIFTLSKDYIEKLVAINRYRKTSNKAFFVRNNLIIIIDNFNLVSHLDDDIIITIKNPKKLDAAYFRDDYKYWNFIMVNNRIYFLKE